MSGMTKFKIIKEIMDIHDTRCDGEHHEDDYSCGCDEVLLAAIITADILANGDVGDLEKEIVKLREENSNLLEACKLACLELADWFMNTKPGEGPSEELMKKLELAIRKAEGEG